MKLVIQYQPSFRRDIKKMKLRGKDLSKLKNIAELLENRVPLPDRYRNHKLVGNYRDYWECHIEPDWLLIYKKTPKTLIFVRTGSHSDLF